MELDLIDIGNSKGVRIPKAIIETCGFENSIHIEVKNGNLILSASRSVRSDWAAAFNTAPINADAKILDPEYIENDWDKEEWTW